MQENYEISISQLGEGKHSRVYSIKGKISQREYIVKIYEERNCNFYNNETFILNNLNNIYPDQGDNNNCFIMYRNIHYSPGMFPIPTEIRGNNLQFLFFDYLPKLPLLDYLTFTKDQIKEIHIKFICYKILKALEQLHAVNICHYDLKESKVMFDNNLNLKLIHFPEAKMINNAKDGYKLNKDIYNLGKILAKIFLRGIFKSINYNPKKNVYIISINLNVAQLEKKYEHMEESQFWKLMKERFKIVLPPDFLKFFKVLVYSKMSRNIVEIDSLLNNEWLREITNDIQKYQDIFRQDFNALYNTIQEVEEKDSEAKTEINNFIDEYENENYTVEDEVEQAPQDIINIYNKENIKEKNEAIDINQINNDFNNLSMNDKKLFTPRKDEFNYLKIDVLNHNNKDIDKAMSTFMRDLKYSIRENYEDTDIKINFKDVKDNSFTIEYGIPPIQFNCDDIVFLDEDFEKKVKNSQKFEIKVELVEGDKSLFYKQKINQFYLVFKGDNVDKEDFYEILTILKNIAKKILINE